MLIQLRSEVLLVHTWQHAVNAVSL